MWAKFALAAAGILTYSAGSVGAVVGYVMTLFIGSAYAPAVAATAAEIFPTSFRATAAGWLTVSGTIGAVVGLVTFGWVFEASASFATAAWVVCVPVAISTVGYRFLPETRGLELEQSAPEVP
jgi:MFS family permease